MTCRGCGQPLSIVFAELGPAPLANSYVSDIDAIETFYPLRAFVCSFCMLAQLPAIETPDAIFSDDYAYFSSVNTGFVEHARRFTDAAIATLGLGGQSRVIEIASNDGYLLQHFVAQNVPALGIEPAANVARVAQDKGIPTEVAFFGIKTANRIGSADLVVANNVLAHVPDLHDFVEGLRIVLAPRGRISIEFPHLLNLIEQTQFDTIYHEHYSYFSLWSLAPVFEGHGLKVVDVERLRTHGGSLRVWLAHAGSAMASDSVGKVLDEEARAGLHLVPTYLKFADTIERCKRHTLEFFLRLADEASSIGGYGAPAKGNTFLNYCGIKPDLLPWTVDGTPHKQGKFLPGTRIPIYAEDYVSVARPDYLLILPWNWRDDIAKRAREVFGYEGRFVTAIPTIAHFA